MSDKKVREMGKRAKEILDRVKPSIVEHPSEEFDDVHPYKGLGFFTEDGQIREGMIGSHLRRGKWNNTTKCWDLTEIKDEPNGQ